MDKNFVAHLQSLETIKDFDVGVGGSPNELNRLSTITIDVTSFEVQLITWLLLEKEFGIDGAVVRAQSEDEGDERPQARSDATDATSIIADGGRIIQRGAGLSTRTLSRLRREQALKYSENLLAAVGVSIPFQCLSPEQRHDLFKLFCSSSNLLIQEKFSSMSEMYNALHRRSKLREEFTLLGRLGSGSFGTVYSVRKKAGEGAFAVKKMILTFDLLELIPMILNESSILKAVAGHENVVMYYDSWLAMELVDAEEEFLEADERDRETDCMDCISSEELESQGEAAKVEHEEGNYVFYLLMEQCWISLKQWKTKFPKEVLSVEQLHRVALGLIDGIEWIHGKGYLHLDINPKNILWKDENLSSVVISDFGLAVVGPTFAERVGTCPYVAPEKILSAKSDIYSLGVSLFEISHQFKTKSEFLRKLEGRNLEAGTELLDAMLPSMLHHRPQQRLSATELKTKFFPTT